MLQIVTVTYRGTKTSPGAQKKHVPVGNPVKQCHEEDAIVGYLPIRAKGQYEPQDGLVWFPRFSKPTSFHSASLEVGYKQMSRWGSLSLSLFFGFYSSFYCIVSSCVGWRCQSWGSQVEGRSFQYLGGCQLIHTTTLDGYIYIQHSKITSDSIRTCRSMSYHDLLCRTLIYPDWMNQHFFSQSQYLLLCRECRGRTWSGSNWPRSSRQSFITIIHIADPSPNPRSASLKRFTRWPRQNHPKRGSQGSLAGMLERKEKLRTQQSLVSFVLCCAGIHGRV